MNKIFNTTFENSLRILLLLSVDKNSKNTDLISVLDFIAIYSKTLGIGNKDLHGQNPFAFCEYTTRRDIINTSIKELVLRGFISVEKSSKGFCYKLTQSGKKAISNLSTDYANNYLIAVKSALAFAKGKNEKQLMSFINKKANEIGGNNE